MRACAPEIWHVKLNQHILLCIQGPDTDPPEKTKTNQPISTKYLCLISSIYSLSLKKQKCIFIKKKNKPEQTDLDLIHLQYHYSCKTLSLEKILSYKKPFPFSAMESFPPPLHPHTYKLSAPFILI